MSAAAEWLLGRAQSYHRDAGQLARLRETSEELTDLQWSVVYRAIAAELYKCADAVTSFHESPDRTIGGFIDTPAHVTKYEDDAEGGTARLGQVDARAVQQARGREVMRPWEERAATLIAACAIAFLLAAIPITITSAIKDSNRGKRCEHAGGVWIDHQCVDRSALLKKAHQ